MKNLMFSFGLILLSFIVSCTSEEDSNQELTTKQTTDAFLKKFYSTDYHFGKKIKTNFENANDSLNRITIFENYSITEVFVGNDDKARGYLFENLDTEEIESFVDVDRINFKLTSVKLENYQIVVKNNINQMPEYFLSDGFDLIGIINNPINSNPTNGTPVTSFGWHYQWGACKDGFRGRYRAFFLLSIQWTDWEPVKNENGVNETYPC